MKKENRKQDKEDATSKQEECDFCNSGIAYVCRLQLMSVCFAVRWTMKAKVDAGFIVRKGSYSPMHAP
jgi:hypothetical protein